MEYEDIIDEVAWHLIEELGFEEDEATHGSAAVVKYLLEKLDEEQTDRLIEALVERRREIRNDCTFDCTKDHIHVRNGIASVTRTVPLIRSYTKREGWSGDE